MEYDMAQESVTAFPEFIRAVETLLTDVKRHGVIVTVFAEAAEKGSTMSEVENLILEHLKRFQTGQDRIERKLDEHTQRLGRIEMAIAGLRRDAALTEEAAAEQSVRFDHLVERIDRIERRLELPDR